MPSPTDGSPDLSACPDRLRSFADELERTGASEMALLVRQAADTLDERASSAHKPKPGVSSPHQPC